ncbi:MAG: hypothetical protein J0L59_06905 [Xanthomonadales bacterium]|nr:hypothetical protein [Xanthomonadales bacterium]
MGAWWCSWSSPASAELVARPWPRTILPQYANEGLTVGFGAQPGRLAAEGNPFAAITALPAPHAALAEGAVRDEQAGPASPAEDAPRP